MAYNAQIALMEARRWFDRATYSMDWDKRDGGEANGTTYFDCSGFVYHLLHIAGAIDASYLQRTHYTGTLKGDLEAAGFVEVEGKDAQAGDIYIWGKDYGAAPGGAAHTGIMTGNDSQISSSWYTRGRVNGAVLELGHDFYWELDGCPKAYFFHYNGDGSEISVDRPVIKEPKTAIDKFKIGGNEFVIAGEMKVAEAKRVNGIFQVRIDELTAEPFDWTDNGIPAVILEKVNVSPTSKADDIKAGDTVQFKVRFNSGTIDEYHEKDNAVGIDYLPGYGRIWYDADKLWNHA